MLSPRYIFLRNIATLHISNIYILRVIFGLLKIDTNTKCTFRRSKW